MNKEDNDSNQTNIHKNVSEAFYDYSYLISCENYIESELILYDLEIILKLKTENMILFFDTIIHHNNKAIKGNRCFVITFTQKNVYNF